MKEIKCDKCTFKFKDGVRCVIDPTICVSFKPKIQNTITHMPSQFNPVPDKVLGDTVLTKGQIANSLQVSIAGVLNMDLKLAKDADTHTRSELKKQGYKSPEEVQAIRSEIAKRLKPYMEYHEHLGIVDIVGIPLSIIAELEEPCQKKI